MFSILFVVLCLENKICMKNVYKILDQPSADDRVAAFREKLFRNKWNKRNKQERDER